MWRTRMIAVSMSIGVVVGLSGALPAGAATKRPAPVTSFSYKSEANDYVGQGQSGTMTPGTVDGMVTKAQALGTSHYLTFTITRGPANGWATDYWTVVLEAPAGKKLHAGTYTNVQRAPFNTGKAAGLDVYGEGRGCNEVYGSFTIKKIVTHDLDDRIRTLDVTFEQHCERANAPALRGEAKWNV